MRISINQPAYLPWGGYFERIALSDLHIILDHVQFEKNSLTNRNRIKGANGPMWLTIPVKTSGRFGVNQISTLEITEGQRWQEKHVKSLENAYRKAPEFESFYSDISASIGAPATRLLAILNRTNDLLLQKLSIKTNQISSSSLEGDFGTKSELVLNLCRHFGATEYLSGPFGRDYLDLKAFQNAGIRVLFHDYHPRPYRQLNGEFVSNLSVVDMIFNEGPAASELFRSASSASII